MCSSDLKRVRTIEYHPIQQSPGTSRPVEFAGGAFRNTTVQPDQWDQHPVDHHLAANKDQGPPPLFLSIQRSPHRRPIPGKRNKQNNLQPTRAQGRSARNSATESPPWIGRTAVARLGRAAAAGRAAAWPGPRSDQPKGSSKAKHRCLQNPALALLGRQREAALEATQKP